MTARTVVIVDDDTTFLADMAALLQGEGFATQVFSTVNNTYEALAAHPPDAAIIGLQFPDSKHGIDLVTLLKLRPATRAMPIIMTSSDVLFLEACATRLRERAVPAVWTLQKPLDMAEVLRLLRQGLENGPPPEGQLPPAR